MNLANPSSLASSLLVANYIRIQDFPLKVSVCCVRTSEEKKS